MSIFAGVLLFAAGAIAASVFAVAAPNEFVRAMRPVVAVAFAVRWAIRNLLR